MKKFMLFLLISFPVFAFPMGAQDIILRGVICSNADSLSLNGAHIELLASDSSVVCSSVSDHNGKYDMKCHIDIDAPPSYLFKVSYVGHATYYTKIMGDLSKPINMGNVYLSSHNLLSEVVISDNTLIYGIDKIIAIPTEIERKASANAIDLLGNLTLPGLMVNIVTRDVNIYGSGAIYQINGRQQSQEQFLAVDPADILRIEYYDSAPIRYMNQGVGGIVNIIMRKKENGGDVFTDVSASPVTGYLNGSARMSYNIRKSEFSLLYNNNWRDYTKRKTFLKESYINDSDIIYRENEGLNAPFGYVDQKIDISYTYQNERSKFNAILKNGVGYQHDENRWNVFESENDNNRRSFYRNSHYKFNAYIPSLDIYFSHKIKDDQSIEVNLVGTLFNSYYRRNLFDDDVPINHNRVDNRRQSLIGEVLYNKMFKDISWDIGVRHHISYTKNTYANTPNSVTKMDVNDSYLYTQIAGMINKMSYSVGTGLKLYKIDNKKESKSYIRNLTTVNMTFPIYDDLRISYRFQLSPTIPSLSQMSNVLQHYDELTGLKGNPSLKSYNTIANRILFIYTKKKFRANFWLSYYTSDNPIALSTYYDNDEKIFISEYLNQKKNDKVNTQIDLILNSLFNHINISVSGGWQRFTSKGKDYEHSLYNLYWSVQLSAYYKRFSLSANYVRPQKTLSAEQIILGQNNSTIMLMYKTNRLSLSLGVYLPFTKDWKSSGWSVSKVNPSYKHVTIRDNGNMLLAGFSYYFNFGRSYNAGKKGITNIDSETGILRVE